MERQWLEETPRDERPAPLAMPALPRMAGLNPAAVLALQGSAGNQAVARMLARTTATEPAAPDTTFLDSCAQYFADNPMSFVRLVLEFTRPWEGVGLFGGAFADIIAAGQDMLAVPHGNFAQFEFSPAKLGYAGLVELTIGMRSILNLAGNVVGHLEMVPNMAVDAGLMAIIAELASGVGAPMAIPTAGATIDAGAISFALGAIKLALTTGTGLCDIAVSLEAGAGVLMFPDEADAWWSLGTGYLANIVGDALGFFNDFLGEITFGASQPGMISQILATLKGVAKTMIEHVRGVRRPPQHDLERDRRRGHRPRAAAARARRHAGRRPARRADRPAAGRAGPGAAGVRRPAR